MELMGLTKINSPRNPGCFSRGSVPWNKGRYCRHSPATEFKAGALRGNAARRWCAIGTIKVRKDHGCLTREIKIADAGKRSERWKNYARYLWEQAHGEIPPRHKIMHDDGDSMNDDLSNLVCVTFREAIALQRRYTKGLTGNKRAAEATRHRHAVNRERRERNQQQQQPVALEPKRDAAQRARANVSAFLRDLEAA